MAETRIWQMNAKREQSVAKCLTTRIDYARDPGKTDGGRLVSYYGCDPDFAAAEFALTKRAYYQKTGREQRREVVVYHVVQSFNKGETTPEEANRVGYEFARRFTGGDFAFVVGTHVNTNYIHNHIVWNSTS
ncbi:MAG: relaxase/mobilization nuclease domain-containing protein, partial [Oscillospiraceae bacterium]|nr:relaxase/mobilization nuclease domain-containing protein [Oscillospiraceae bacterium]